MRKIRVYRIENPSHPREPETEKAVWFTNANGVIRTVKHDGEANVVTWDYTHDKHS